MSKQQGTPGKKPGPITNAELHQITVKGFFSIKSIEKLALRPINLLIGANGSGKSNFVGVFSLLRALRQGRLVDYTDARGGAERILHFGSKATKEIELEISFRDDSNRYHVVLSPTAEDRFFVHDEWCWYWEKSHHPKPLPEGLSGSGKEAGISKPQRRVPKWVQSGLDSWQIYHFHDTSENSLMKKTGELDDNRLFRANASNLASYLYLLSKEHQSEYQLIRKTVQRVAPFLHDFHLEPLRRNPKSIKLEWIHKSSDSYFDAAALSDGTLRFICLSTLFLQPFVYRPSVILVDEPELGLHPYAITMRASLIKTAATKTQIIISTQSALLLDHFEPEDVLVAQLERGSTTMTRLQSKDLAVWLEEYSLGQLWEKNQFGGRPGRV
ncbi:MAG: AAA family ATPase [Isosphaerales bacterium]